MICRIVPTYKWLCHLFIAALFAACSANAYADASLSIQPQSGSIGQTYLFGISIREETIQSPPVVPDTDDFTVKFVGPQQSVKIVNGTISSEITYFYRLKPKHAGSLETPPVTVNLQSGPVSPTPLTVDVRAGTGASPGSGDNADDRTGILFEQTATPMTVFRGQQVVDTAQILTPFELRGLQVSSPNKTDFWEEEIHPDEQDQEVRNGKAYAVVRIRKALFPLKSGALKIAPTSLTAEATSSRMGSMLDDMDPFSSHFMSNIFSLEPNTVELSTNETSVAVLDLPAVPTDLPLWSSPDPLVGRVSLSASVNTKKINPGDPKEVAITLETDGNANALNELPFPEDARWRIYPAQTQASTQFKGGKLVTTKVFHVSVVPTSGGNLEIPSIKLGYFDPETSQFKVAETGTISIPVSGDAAPIASPTPLAATSPSVEPDATAVNEPQEPNQQPRSARAYILIALGTVIAGFGIWELLKRQKTSNPGTPAKAVAAQAIKEDEVTSISFLYKTLINSIERRFGSTAHAGSARSLIRDALLDSPTRFKIESVLDEVEEYLYGRSEEISPETFEELKHKVFSLIKNW